MSQENTQVIGVRFDQDRVEEIESRAEAENLNKSEFIRRAISRELGETLIIDRVSVLEESVERLLTDRLEELGIFPQSNVDSTYGTLDPANLQMLHQNIREHQNKQPDNYLGHGVPRSDPEFESNDESTE